MAEHGRLAASTGSGSGVKVMAAFLPFFFFLSFFEVEKPQSFLRYRNNVKRRLMRKTDESLLGVLLVLFRPVEMEAGQDLLLMEEWALYTSYRGMEHKKEGSPTCCTTSECCLSTVIQFISHTLLACPVARVLARAGVYCEWSSECPMEVPARI